MTNYQDQTEERPRKFFYSQRRSSKRQWWQYPSWLIIFVILAISLGLNLYLFIRSSQESESSMVLLRPASQAAKNKSKYEAVFLDNGQVYFGQISKETDSYVVLNSVYYLQSQGPGSPGRQDLLNNLANMALIKMGREMHGPADEMKIFKEHILFIEPLRENSKVVEAIKANL